MCTSQVWYTEHSRIKNGEVKGWVETNNQNVLQTALKMGSDVSAYMHTFNRQVLLSTPAAFHFHFRSFKENIMLSNIFFPINIKSKRGPSAALFISQELARQLA